MAIDDASNDVGEIGVGLDVYQLTDLDQRGEDSPMLAATVGTGEQGVLAV